MLAYEVEHSKLSKSTVMSAHSFLHTNDQYVREIYLSAWKHIAKYTTATDAVTLEYRPFGAEGS